MHSLSIGQLILENYNFMNRQSFDIGDLVEFEDGRSRRQGLVLEKKPINSKFKNIPGREYHVDEYHCKVKFIDDEATSTTWVRAKWLKLLSQAK